MKTKLFSLFLTLFATTCLWAYDFKSGDLYYNITSNVQPYTVEVTKNGTYKLSSVTIPSTVNYKGTNYAVTSIEEYAFCGCDNLNSITIGDNVTTIGDYAFYYCSALTSIAWNAIKCTDFSYSPFDSNSPITSFIFGEKVEHIPAYLCSQMDSLISITIPNSVTNIGSNAFYYCSALTKTNYTGDVAGWCDIKFGNSSSNPMYYSHNFYINDQEIKDLVIPNTVDTIHDYAFYECSSLTTVTIPNSVTSIGNNAFSYCSSITSVTIPNSVTSIGNNAFYNCSSLTSISIPNSVTSIGNYAFYNCYSITSLTIPNSVTNIAYNAFYNCCFLKKDFINNSSLDAEENNYWGALVGDLEIDGLIISGTTVIWGRKNLTNVAIPNYITVIGERAFNNCSSLTSVTIPNSVTNIEYNAFNGCEALTKTNYTGDVAGWCDIKFDSSSSNPMYSSHNFYINDQEIKDLVIPNTVDTIHNYAFYKCSSLTTVTIGNSVTSIGTSAFDYCSSLTSVTIGESVTNIGNYAFSDCESLTSVTIPNSVTSIGNWAFYGCSSLTSINIPESMINIGFLAFDYSGIYNDDSNWEDNVLYIDNCLIAIKPYAKSGEYTIKDGVRLIAGGAFWDQYDVTTVIFPNSVKSISMRAFSGTNITSIVIPDSVRNIEQMAFYNCRYLTEVSLGSGIASIEERLFDGCNALKHINIPEGVKNIGRYAFRSCKALEYVILSSNTPPTIDPTAFNSASKPICYIPCGALAAYQSSDWNNIASSLVELCDENMKIFYTSSDGKIITPYNLYALGAKILDNSYKNGQGVITFQTPISQIGAKTFYNCTSLTSITIPNSVTSIGEYAFSNCTSLSSIELSNSTTSIEQNTFSNCTSLTSITIPNSVTSIGEYAFSNCTTLDSITIPNSVTSIGEYAFSNCTSLASIELSNSITSIEQKTFYNCSALTEITIPNSVRSIEFAAFEDCIRLSKVHIGSSMETIAENVFAGCKRLYDIYSYAPYPPFAELSSFANYNVYLYVPCEKQRDYILDVVWGNFKFIECISSDNVTTNGVIITPTTNDVTIIWPTETNAETYTIVIKKGDKVFCTLTFNANGQLLNIAFAPSRDGTNHTARYAEQVANGYRFTVTGLEEGTDYTYSIDVKDTSNQTIKSYSGEFSTQAPTAVEDLTTEDSTTHKLLRDGQLFILREGKTYNAQGILIN